MGKTRTVETKVETGEVSILRGSALPRGTRRPRTVEDRRICAARGCRTVLSRYNPRSTCHVHAPVRYPRIRGSVVES